LFQELTVDLQRPPQARWNLTPEQCEQARELFRQYKADLGLSADVGEFLISCARDLGQNEYWEEMESLAHQTSLSVSDVALCNFYYDALKAVLGRVFGCTAFAFETPGGILHARNLDWWTDNSALARYTAVCHFVGGAAGEFTIIGWPGFVGAFSGIAPGRFAVTLNAVLSLEPAQLATPVVFLLRAVLEKARSFDEAFTVLSKSPIPCDCLLLLTGTRSQELVVIERTPSRCAIRGPEAGFVAVTNGYQKLDAGLGTSSPGLLGTWCQRFQRVGALVGKRRPQSVEDCFEYLGDPEVQMHMTVQQMVFRVSTGEHWIRLPHSVETA
jgi:predicted choloylglycine hydrolase